MSLQWYVHMSVMNSKCFQIIDEVDNKKKFAQYWYPEDWSKIFSVQNIHT